jgi:hypothetical protein
MSSRGYGCASCDREWGSGRLANPSRTARGKQGGGVGATSASLKECFPMRASGTLVVESDPYAGRRLFSISSVGSTANRISASCVGAPSKWAASRAPQFPYSQEGRGSSAGAGSLPAGKRFRCTNQADPSQPISIEVRLDRRPQLFQIAPSGRPCQGRLVSEHGVIRSLARRFPRS